MKSVCSTICAPSWRRRERPASGSSSFPIADGSRAITKTGIIRTQASAGCKSGRSSQRETWGGEWHPDFVPQAGDIVVKEHWAQSGFANTDLDFQLKQHCITHVVTVGLLANTCIESTSRFAMELGYHVTPVRDATAAFSHEHMHAAHDLNGPTFAHAILTTPELLAALPPAVS